MFITDKSELEKYGAPYRIWQGIPGIEVTKKGRIFSTFYSGGTSEQVNNFVVLYKSDDQVDFGDPVAVCFKEGYRCYDPCLWIDPLDRLWLVWARAPEHSVYAVICDDPDADTLVWSEVFKIGEDVMMNKPAVLTTGEWLFPIAVWHRNVTTGGFSTDRSDEERKAFAYKTIDCGKSFVKLGGTDIAKRSFDEHMILELKDGRLAMYVRTSYGIAVSYSYDRGKTWTAGSDSKLGGPCSRFFITRLKSGRVLLVNHYNFVGRSHLTAMLSEDEGKTWPYKLLIDERKNVSYPDAKEADDGYIYITYDRERGGYLKSFDGAYSCAREILYAKISEEDIINGALKNENSKLKVVISKLGKYAREYENPYGEVTRLPEKEVVKRMLELDNEALISFIFEHYSVNCINMHNIDRDTFDRLIDSLNDTSLNREETLAKIVALAHSVDDFERKNLPIVGRVEGIIKETLNEDISVGEIAKRLDVSVYYMCHAFKKATGVTIVDYRNELKIVNAKKLLISTDKKITEIASECGFDSDSYFGKIFKQYENLSPAQYRSSVRNIKG